VLATFTANLAALATILLFVSDPFTQQVLQYAACNQTTTDLNSAISRTNRLAATDYQSYDNTVSGSLMGTSTTLASSIMNGFYDPSRDLMNVVSVNCTSGNCTFPSFSTLGICSSCRDISDEIAAVSLNSLAVTIKDPLINKDLSLGSDQVQYSSGTTPLLVRDGPQLAGVAILTRLATNSFAAFTCSLDPCLKQYQSVMENGKLKETLTDTKPIGTNVLYEDGTEPSVYRLATSKALVNGEWQKCNPSMSSGSDLVAVEVRNVDAAPNFPVGFNSTAPGPHTISYYPKHCVWDLEYDAIHNFGVDFLEGVSSLNLNNVNSPPDAYNYPSPFGQTPGFNFYQNGSATLESTSALMEAIADSITVAMRRVQSGEWQQGHGYYNTTCANVKWPWLSFLAIVTVFSLVFFATAVTSTRRRGLAWKSSSLAVLFVNLDDNIARHVSKAKTIQEMSQAAKSVKGQLMEVDGRFTFVSDG
jgi:hypothetical protein